MTSALLTTVLDNLPVALLFTFSLYSIVRVTYERIFSPLSEIPGPWYAAISDFWLTTHVLRLRQCKTIHSLFEIYGPVVRVGPNKVVFCDVNTTRSVYTKFDKSFYYKSLLTNNNDHAMTTLDHASHAQRRKAYSQHYIPNYLTQFQPEMHDFTLQLVNILEGIAGKTSLDCLALFRHLMVDVLAATSLGSRVGAMSKWAMGIEDPLCTAINDFPKRGILRSAVPKWAWNLVCKIPNNRWRQMTDSDRIMAEFVSSRAYEMRAQMHAGKLGGSEKIPMLQRLLQHRYPGSNDLMRDNDAISEAMGHLIAGSDTTSTSLSYWFWELSRRPDVTQKLQSELDVVMPDAQTIPDILILQKLPYLSAFVKEGLRLYGAAPSLLERVVPTSSTKSGAVNEGLDLMGYALTPGTVVATQAWSMHRDPSVFPSPDTFLPDRWLDVDAPKLAKMTQYMMPFGTGSRICGGMQLAQMMLRIVVAAIARNFDILAPTETSERSMEMRDSFVLFPASMECKLVFIPRNQ